MIRWILGLLVVGGMGGTGYAVLRPHLDRPALGIASFLPKDDPLSRELEEGVLRALKERDGRGGAFRVSYLPCDYARSWLAVDAAVQGEDSPGDHSNSSYAALGVRMPEIILPGLGRRELVAWPSEGGFLVPLRLEEDGRRAARMGWESAAVVSCHTALPPEKPLHFHSGGTVDHAAVTFLEKSRELSPLVLPLSRRGAPEKRIDETVTRLLEARPALVYLDLRDWADVVVELREIGFEGEVLIPSARLGKDVSQAEGCLTLLSHLRPASARFSHPFAEAAYRSCLRTLDALDRLRATTPEVARRAFESCIPYDPFLDPALATVGVYRIRAGRFERVAVLPRPRGV